MIFWVGRKNCIMKNQKCIFPESRFINSNPVGEHVTNILIALLHKSIHFIPQTATLTSFSAPIVRPPLQLRELETCGKN